MTKVLKLAFLGRMRLEMGETLLSGLASSKARALLAYLAVNGRSHSRQSLAGLLWPDMPEADARRNLRGDLMKLRQVVEPYLTVTHQTIAFNVDSDYWLDVAEFKRLAAPNLQSRISNSQLETAVSLYRGEFLEDFYVRQAPQFEAWVMQQRAELRAIALSAYQSLTAVYAQRGEYEAGIGLGRRWLALDQTNEAAHRQMMRLLASQGQRSAALTQFEACRQILADELGVEPGRETAVLYQSIKSGQWETPSTSQRLAPTLHPSALSLQPFIAGPPITRPSQFYGRQREIKRIFNLLQRPPLQNAAVIGDRRSGKTSLLHHLRTIAAAPPQQLRPDQRRNWLPDPARYRWVFVDFQDARMGQSANLLRYLLEQMGFSHTGGGDLDTFLDVVSDNLTAPTVILFDEIGVAMARYPELDDAFWESLRSLATNQTGGNLAFILAAHESPAELARHGGLGSPFFNIFGYTARLGPLTDAEARQLIASSPIPFSEADVDWLLAESGRWPMPLQILCRERLLTLEEGETGDGWREDALRQAAPFLKQEA